MNNSFSKTSHSIHKMNQMKKALITISVIQSILVSAETWGHIAILDHPDNAAFPTPWRVDDQLGVGPSRQILGNWHLWKDETTVEKYRLVIYTGELDREKMAGIWKNYVCESQN